MTSIQIGNKGLEIPLIQGGMGIGVSRSSLAGAVAGAGGMGVISAAQVGYDAPGFRENPEGENLRVLPLEIQKAKEIAGGRGMVGVNLLSVTQLYGDYVKTAVAAGADAILSGAGLPLNLPEYVQGAEVKIAPVVSSFRGAELMMRIWDRKYGRNADFLVMESPYSGGHQGYSRKCLENLDAAFAAFAEDVRRTVEGKKRYEEKYRRNIPLFVAGGIFTAQDVSRALSWGADGVQVGTRFITTHECDASESYKRVFVESKAEDLVIIDSPVGMPARAVRNAFVERMLEGREEISFCYNCLKACNPAQAKYCISQALINAVTGDLEHGLIFASAKVGEIQKIQSVQEVIAELFPCEG